MKLYLKFILSGIYPLHDVHIRKVKVMKRPRFDLNKLMDMHGEGSGELLTNLSQTKVEKSNKNIQAKLL